LVLLLAALALAAADAAAAGFGRSRKGRSSSSSSSSSSRASSTASRPSHGTVVRGSPGRSSASFRAGSRVRRSFGAPLGWGYGWGAGSSYLGPAYYGGWGVHPYGYYARGYHPYFGAPATVGGEPEASDTSLAIWLGGFAAGNGGAVDGALRLEGERWGVSSRTTLLGLAGPDAAAMPLASLHLTYSLVSEPEARVRFEAGGTLIVAPDFVYAGPDMGLTAQVALLGPLGLYAGAYLTPTPARILDAEAGASLQFGGLGLRAGYRVVHLDDRLAHGNDPEVGGVELFHGWQAGIGLVF
jgi:hypothetical protein